jgi:hypothetical protein
MEDEHMETKEGGKPSPEQLSLSSFISTVLPGAQSGETASSNHPFREERRAREADKENQKLVSAFLDGLKEKLPNMALMSKLIYNALSASLLYDLSFEHALDRLQRENENGIVELGDMRWLQQTNQKLSRLLFASNLIDVSGLLPYKESIMEGIISQLFELPPKLAKDSTTKKIEELLRTKNEEKQQSPSRTVKVREKMRTRRHCLD